MGTRALFARAAEAAEEHGRLCCSLVVRPTLAVGSRAAGPVNAAASGKGEDELHLCLRLETCPTGSFTTRCTERDLVCLPRFRATFSVSYKPS